MLLEQRKYEYPAHPARGLRSHLSTPATGEQRSGEFLKRRGEFTGRWRPGGILVLDEALPASALVAASRRNSGRAL